jgi:hypothetical protein
MEARMRVVVFAASCALGALVLLPARASADRAAAEQNFHTGKEAYARGDFRGAASAFEAAFRDDPHGSAIYNAALARQLAGQTPQAADDFDAALVQHGLNVAELTGEQAADARSRLRALEATLGRVDVSATDGAVVSLPGTEPVPAPARIHVVPGSYSVHVAWPNGQSVDRPASVAAGAVAELTVAPLSSVAMGTAPRSPPPAPDEPTSSAGHRGWTYAAVGVGGVGIVVGVVTGAMTLSARQTVVADCDVNGVANDCRNAAGVSAGERGETTGLISTIGFVAGGVGAAAAVILWLTEPDSTKRSSKKESAWQPFVAGAGARDAVIGVRGIW